jgi:uncharacterized phage protein (TIGR02216 family)
LAGSTEQFADLAAQHGGWAMAALGWTPESFWRATPADVRMAFRGWCRLHGIEASGKAADRDALASLMKRFPD